MRTREEILAAAASTEAQSKASHLTVLEVLLDVRDELVAQGRPTEAALGHLHLASEKPGAACGEPGDQACTWDASKIDCRACRLLLDLNAAKLEAADAKARLELYAKADHGLMRVAGLVGVDTSTLFSIDAVIKGVESALIGAEAFAKLQKDLLSYLGMQAGGVVSIVEAVRNLGSLAQDRKDRIEELERDKAELAAEVDRWEESV